MNKAPSLLESHVSQIPALQLLQNLGYTYLPPSQLRKLRKEKNSQILLEEILEEQLYRLNHIHYKGKKYQFSNGNVFQAIRALQDIPFDGLVRTNEKVYDLLCLGKSFEETIGGDTKSFTLRYIDWEVPENNVFHVSAEFAVERSQSRDIRVPDIVLFVNGIPFVVIECKAPSSSVGEAVSQQIRNQKNEEIPLLFIYSQLLLATNKNEVRYATVGTPEKFWSVWREKHDSEKEVLEQVLTPLSFEAKQALFQAPFENAPMEFEALVASERQVTEQDKAIYSLCRPQRLMELVYKFIVFDGGEKKIARYQQYFATKNTLNRIASMDEEGKRKGGVLWHTQGSGKSLLMVMLAKNIALAPEIRDCRIVLVTDRVDLDDQIYSTFYQCGKDPIQARTGKHLMKLIAENKEAIITTVIDKFGAAVKRRDLENKSQNVFVLVDESHRTQYGSLHVEMLKTLPHACYIGFTGTPLMKNEKNTAQKFGGIIDKYTLHDAVADKAVLPLLYEGRHAIQEVSPKIDLWFERISEPLSDEQKKDLKKKHSSADQLNKADRKIYTIAYDISLHFQNNWQGTPYKGQLAAPSKLTALKYKKYLDEFAMVSSAVLISPPDTREGHEDTYEETQDEIQLFWRKMMERYGNEKNYNNQVIQSFKHDNSPEIIIVVDKLLTGFDAPRNTVLYLTRRMQNHGLLQAIARVNRLCQGKEFGYILDYYGLLGDLNKALNEYSALENFEEEDIRCMMQSVEEESSKLPERHSQFWDIFKGIAHKFDVEAYEQMLADDALRIRFYDKLSAYARILSISLATLKFAQSTPQEKIQRYKDDLKFFMKLRTSVKLRYAETIDFKEYESKIQKLVDRYVGTDEIQQITQLVDIFDKEKFAQEIAKIESPRAQADTIAHRTKKVITEKMEEDPAFYQRFSQLLEKTIQENDQRRLDDAGYLREVKKIMEAVRNHTSEGVPPELQGHDQARAFYGVIQETFTKISSPPAVPVQMALIIEQIIEKHAVVEWITNLDIQNTMRNEMEEYLYSVKDSQEISLTFDDIDDIMERCLQIARHRYSA